MAAEFRDVDAGAALARLDALGRELAEAAADGDGSPAAEAEACRLVLGGVHGFAGQRAGYDDPVNSMLDRVLVRRRGLPILLSVVYVEVARRAAIPLRGVGLPGHFVVGHFGGGGPVPILLLDPFAGGHVVGDPVPPALTRPWSAHEIALRMLNNVVGSYVRRGDLGAALRAATMRLDLPAAPSVRETLEAERRALRARLN